MKTAPASRKKSSSLRSRSDSAQSLPRRSPVGASGEPSRGRADILQIQGFAHAWFLKDRVSGHYRYVILDSAGHAITSSVAFVDRERALASLCEAIGSTRGFVVLDGTTNREQRNP